MAICLSSQATTQSPDIHVYTKFNEATSSMGEDGAYILVVGCDDGLCRSIRKFLSLFYDLYIWPTIYFDPEVIFLVSLNSRYEGLTIIIYGPYSCLFQKLLIDLIDFNQTQGTMTRQDLDAISSKLSHHCSHAHTIYRL